MNIMRRVSTGLKSSALLATFAAILVGFEGRSSADVIDRFEDIAQTTTGQFVWDDFSQADPFNGPHDTQVNSGIGTGVITATPGGIVTTTKNLYSLFTVATFSHDLTGLQNSEATQNVVLEVAFSSDSLSASNFALGGDNPDEFINLGSKGNSNGYTFYWAEWNGLSNLESLSVTLQGTAQHQSLGGSKLSYINSANATNISAAVAAVPEPSSLLLLCGMGLGLSVIRRRK